MKVTISDFIIAFFDLLEAEGREFRKNIQKTFLNSSLLVLGIIISGFLFLISIFAFAFGLYMWLKTIFSAYTSAFILSFVFFIVGIVLVLFIKQKNERT